MGLPASEQRVPGTIENELQITDQQLAGAFAASPDSPVAPSCPSSNG